MPDHRPPPPNAAPIRFRVLDLRPQSGLEYVVAIPRTKASIAKFEVFDGSVQIIGVEHFPELEPKAFAAKHDRLPEGNDYRAAFAALFGRSVARVANREREAAEIER